MKRRIRKVNEGNKAVNMVAVYKKHTWKCHDEIHYSLFSTSNMY